MTLDTPARPGLRTGLLPASVKAACLRWSALKVSLVVTTVSVLMSIASTWLIIGLFSLPPAMRVPMLSTATVVPLLITPVVTYFFVELMRKLEEARAALHDLAMRDGLTRLFNRRYLMERAAEEVAKALRHGQPLSLAILDADDFKRVNDEADHAAGDEVLKALAGAFAAALRCHDVPARYGGEEFVVLFPMTPASEARLVAERLRMAVEALVIPVGEGQVRRITVSIGLSTLGGPTDDLKQLLSRADSALYQSKREGKNRSTAL